MDIKIVFWVTLAVFAGCVVSSQEKAEKFYENNKDDPIIDEFKGVVISVGRERSYIFKIDTIGVFYLARGWFDDHFKIVDEHNELSFKELRKVENKFMKLLNFLQENGIIASSYEKNLINFRVTKQDYISKYLGSTDSLANNLNRIYSTAKIMEYYDARWFYMRIE